MFTGRARRGTIGDAIHRREERENGQSCLPSLVRKMRYFSFFF
jgi:hypothetical protein